MHKVPIEKIVHDKCGKRSLQIWKKGNKYDGFCFYCHTIVRNPYSDKPEGYSPPAPKIKSKEEIQQEIREIQEYQFLDLPDRKIGRGTLRHFGVRVAVSEENGTDIVAHYYPYRTKGEITW